MIVQSEMKDRVVIALAEAVAHGLDDGWKRCHQGAHQPRKRELLNVLYDGVMKKIETVLEEHKK